MKRLLSILTLPLFPAFTVFSSVTAKPASSTEKEQKEDSEAQELIQKQLVDVPAAEDESLLGNLWIQTTASDFEKGY